MTREEYLNELETLLVENEIENKEETAKILGITIPADLKQFSVSAGKGTEGGHHNERSEVRRLSVSEPWTQRPEGAQP